MDHQFDEPDLRSYLGVIAHRKWWVIGITALVLGVAIAMSVLTDPVYRAKATVQTVGLNDPVAAVTGQSRNGLDGNRLAQGEFAYIGGAEMHFNAIAAATGQVDNPNEMVKIKASERQASDSSYQSTSVVDLTLLSSDPDRAKLLLNIYVQTYLGERRASDQAMLLRALAGVEAEIEQLNKEIKAINDKIDPLLDQAVDAQANGNTALADLRRRQYDDKRADVQPALSAKYTTINNLSQNVNNLRFGLGMTNGSGASVVSSASVSKTPVSPNVPRNLALGLVFGLFLGVSLAFLRDYFDDSIQSKEQVERATGVPALGLIPKFDTEESELVAAAFPASPAAEAFRSLRTSVKFLGVDRDMRVVQVTSPSPSEGKTVVAANLATVFAQAGDRVVLVSGDLRRPRVEELLGVSLTPGLTGVLIGEVSLPQAIRPVDGVPNLSVLPAGMPPPNPSELLSGERARRLVDVLAQTYDLVLLDCPPILPVTDALVLARMADTTLLVTSAKKTSRRGLDRTVELLTQVGAPLVGVVMSSLSKDATYSHEPYGYEASMSGRKAYDRSYDLISGYGSQPETGQVAQQPPADAPLAGQTSHLPAVPGNDHGPGLWPSELPGRG